MFNVNVKVKVLDGFSLSIEEIDQVLQPDKADGSGEDPRFNFTNMGDYSDSEATIFTGEGNAVCTGADIFGWAKLAKGDYAPPDPNGVLDQLGITYIDAGGPVLAGDFVEKNRGLVTESVCNATVVATVNVKIDGVETVVPLGEVLHTLGFSIDSDAFTLAAHMAAVKPF